MNGDLQGRDGFDKFYEPAHKLAISCALVHLLLCASIAFYTDTWLLVLFVGVPAVVFPAWLAMRYPAALISRLAMATGFMILTGLVIEQSHGDMEAHFSAFVMMPVLVVYFDWRPIAMALAAILTHHVLLNVLQPMQFGFYIWNDGRDGWGHVGVHVVAGVLQASALMVLAQTLRKRRLLKLKNAELDRTLRKLGEEAARDALTGLHNRTYLNQILSDLGPRVRAGDEDVTCWLVDIDRFKSINDGFGHPIGDEVLVSMARILKMSLLPNDCAIRHGGEEFLVILLGRTLDEGAIAADLLRKRIADSAIVTAAGSIQITASIGVATWRRDEVFHDCYVRMDKALYAAKQGGRNRVQVAADPKFDRYGGTWSAVA